jgi:hypothetical protein
MRKIVNAFLVPLVVLGLSCEKTKDDINEATEFDISYSSQVSIPSTSISVTAPAEFSTPEISTQSASRFASENTTKDLIDEITVSKFNISNPNGNLDYLKSITVYIQADNMGDVQIAAKSNIPAGTTSVAADLSGANIKDFIVKDKIKFKVKVTISTGLTANQTLKVDVTVKVKGKKIK